MIPNMLGNLIDGALDADEYEVGAHMKGKRLPL
jgi:hypothetical protein